MFLKISRAIYFESYIQKKIHILYSCIFGKIQRTLFVSFIFDGMKGIADGSI